jgi:hypothetical protein
MQLTNPVAHDNSRSIFMKNRIDIPAGLQRDEHDQSVPANAGGEAREVGGFILAQQDHPNNDSIESFMGHEGVGIRPDEPSPIATAGDCCALFSFVDGSADPSTRTTRPEGPTISAIKREASPDLHPRSRTRMPRSMPDRLQDGCGKVEHRIARSPNGLASIPE